MNKPFLSLACAAVLLTACGSDSNTSATQQGDTQPTQHEDLTAKTLVANKAAYIPAQCYTKTLDANGVAHNPCMSCHVPSKAPNYLDDGDLQLSYSFAEYANTNRWQNLFKDRSHAIAAMSDEHILQYIRQDNYQSNDNIISLALTLQSVPSGWDFDKDGKWSGFIPDCSMNFDNDGFDRKPDNNYSGWRAFAYAPFLGTFWPTNGSTDDVLIRLGEPFRNTAAGNFDLTTYKVNLAIVEALIKRADMPIEAVDENLFAVDLDKDGRLATATQIRYDWAPREGRFMSYVGQAKTLQDNGELHLAAGLYPEGTEFLHSVRYLDLDETGTVTIAPRMKELRYARKASWRTYPELEDFIMAEVKDKDAFPDRLRQLIGNVEYGISNGQGWVYQGFIEDKHGDLRPQTYEETVACMGCHGGIGATADSSFAFPRKFSHEAFQQGWYHWSQRGLQGQAEPKRADGEYEYSHYLLHNGAGDEFRENREVIQQFFDVSGKLKPEALVRLHSDVSELLLPSAERALQLNKAYKVLVDEQSFIYGRDTLLAPPANVHETVTDGQETGVTEIIRGASD